MNRHRDTAPAHRDPSVDGRPLSAKVASYIIGFVLSVILTLLAYSLVVNGVLGGWNLIYALVGLAVVQLLVQLLFFLHLGRESEPRWNLLVFDFTLVVVIILVVGSLWIMNNLHYNMTPQDRPSDIRNELRRQPGGF